MLWRAGENNGCQVCLHGNQPCFPNNNMYRDDNITERLHLFAFKKYQDLEMFMKRYIHFFEAPTGCILYLYSMALSRTVPKIIEDLEDAIPQLLTDNEDVSGALVNLLLTGRATRHLHNGKIDYSEDGEALNQPMVGILERSEIGFLYWHKDEANDNRTQVGSMLKTPRCPVWITKVNGQFGCLFS
ncbi:unnamed protein product, partial [Owenia fusiformis]